MNLIDHYVDVPGSSPPAIIQTNSLLTVPPAPWPRPPRPHPLHSCPRALTKVTRALTTGMFPRPSPQGLLTGPARPPDPQ